VSYSCNLRFHFYIHCVSAYMHVVIFLYFKSCKQENGYVSFRAFAIDILFLLGCCTMSLGGWYPIFWDSIVVLSSMVQMFMKNEHFKPWRWDQYAVSEWWPPVTQWHGTTSQNNRHFKHMVIQLFYVTYYVYHQLNSCLKCICNFNHNNNINSLSWMIMIIIIIIIIIIIYLVFQRPTRVDIELVIRQQQAQYKMSLDNKIRITVICDYNT
jgi:hypothetical protein